MTSSTMQEKKLQRVVTDIELLANELISDYKVKKRIKDIQMNPSIGKSEEELDNYLNFKLNL